MITRFIDPFLNVMFSMDPTHLNQTSCTCSDKSHCTPIFHLDVSSTQHIFAVTHITTIYLSITVDCTLTVGTCRIIAVAHAAGV